MPTLYGFLDPNGKYQFSEDQLPMHKFKITPTIWPPEEATPIACLHPVSQIAFNAEGFGVCQTCFNKLRPTGWEVV